MALSGKQAAFVREYLIDLNATQAAVRAGYSQKTAAGSGYENLRKPQIQEAIAEHVKSNTEKTAITPDQVLRDIQAIKLDAMRATYDKDGNEVMANHTAALKACELQGKHLQMWVDRVAMTIEQVPDEEIDGRILELSRKAGASVFTH